MDDISDPLGDRVMKNVPFISRFPLTKDQLWHISGNNSQIIFIFQRYDLKSIYIKNQNIKFYII